MTLNCSRPRKCGIVSSRAHWAHTGRPLCGGALEAAALEDLLDNARVKR